MHFTELSTLSGTATLSVGGTISVPAGILNGGMATGAISPNFGETSTPTFNIAVLETQEFYQGMLKALSMDELATYLNEGLPPELVFSLSIGQILYQDAPGDAPIAIENSFRKLKVANRSLCAESVHSVIDASEYECFRSVLRSLLNAGLTTEMVKTTINVGPPVLATSFSDLRWLNGFEPRALRITSLDAEDCTQRNASCPEGFDALPPEQQKALANKQKLYRVQKDSFDSRFCFNHKFESNDPRLRAQTSATTAASGLTSAIENAHIDERLICSVRITEADKRIILKDPNAPNTTVEKNGATTRAPAESGRRLRRPAHH